MASDAFYGWVAEQLLGELRGGRIPRGLTPGDMAFIPMLEAVRERVRDDDQGLALRLAADSETLMWGAMLSRHFLSDKDLTALLMDAFVRESTIDRQIGLFHHLTARELTDDEFQQLMTWLEQNLEVFIEDQAHVFEGPEGEDRLLARISSDDPGLHRKRWVYMFSALAFSPEVARPVLEKHLDDVDVNVATAARTALSRLSS